jgi:endonuclease/exonuclease/phosphatase family metal-dependent hydrolase
MPGTRGVSCSVKPAPGARESATRCRIASFNIENFGDTTGRGAAIAERIALMRPQLLRLDADILCLQEVDSQRDRGKERRLAALDQLIADTPYADYHRLATLSRSRRAPRDKHNLVILSRWPFSRELQVLHDLVTPPLHRTVHDSSDADTGQSEQQPIEWDRPLLYAAVELPVGRRLHLINLHLRAPRAAFLPGQKTDANTWRSMAAWAEGFFLASVKRAGQALEARLFIDQLFDAEPDALIAVCGDFNADAHEVPVRTICGDEEDAGNPHLALRTLVPVERSLADSLRFSVVHHGRPQMLDHVLVSRPLLAWYRSVEVHNEALGDELVTSQAVRGSPESFHAPVIASFHFTPRTIRDPAS